MTGGPSLRVLTFNIRHGLAPDGRDSWPFRRTAVMATIRRAGAHVVCLQEVRGFQQRWLRRRLPELRMWGRARGRRLGEKLVVAWDRSRVRVVDRGAYWLSEHPDAIGLRGWDAALPRVCVWAVLDERDLGRFAVHNVHLDSRGVVARLEGARQVRDRILSHGALPVLVCGDLNAGEEMPPVLALKEAGLVDTFRVAHPDADGRTFHRFDGRPRYTKLDYVLADRSWKTLDATIHAEPVGTRWPSDHFPVSADLTLGAG